MIVSSNGIPRFWSMPIEIPQRYHDGALPIVRFKTILETVEWPGGSTLRLKKTDDKRRSSVPRGSRVGSECLLLPEGGHCVSKGSNFRRILQTARPLLQLREFLIAITISPRVRDSSSTNVVSASTFRISSRPCCRRLSPCWAIQRSIAGPGLDSIDPSSSGPAAKRIAPGTGRRPSTNTTPTWRNPRWTPQPRAPRGRAGRARNRQPESESRLGRRWPTAIADCTWPRSRPAPEDRRWEAAANWQIPPAPAEFLSSPRFEWACHIDQCACFRSASAASTFWRSGESR